jgi:hypothetical protein
LHYTTAAAAAADATTTTTASHNTTLHDVTVDYETLYHTIRHNNTRHYAALRYSITPQDDSNYISATTPRHCSYSHKCNYNYNCTTQHYMQQTTQLQVSPPVGASVLRSAIRDSQQLTSPIGFLFFTLPRPPCAVMLENIVNISGNRSICNDMK